LNLLLSKIKIALVKAELKHNRDIKLLINFY